MIAKAYLKLSEDERVPNPLSIIHIPLTVTFAFYDQGYALLFHFIKAYFSLETIKVFHSKYLLVDPNEIEERCMDGKLIIGMNKYREYETFISFYDDESLKSPMKKNCSIN